MWKSAVRSVRLFSSRASSVISQEVAHPAHQTARRSLVSARRRPSSHLLLPRALSRRLATPADDGTGSLEAAEEGDIERFPLPDGISKDKFGLYELLDSSKDMRDVTGENAVMAVHGPEEHWLPKGREGHGSCGGMFAVIGTSGTQYKVMAGDVLYTNRAAGDVNTQFVFDWVLAIGTFDWTVFGRPLIRQARVVATIEEQTRSAKVMATKYKKRKGYLRRRGHRQPITRFRIDKIDFALPGTAMIRPYHVTDDPKRPAVPNHLRFI